MDSILVKCKDVAKLRKQASKLLAENNELKKCISRLENPQLNVKLCDVNLKTIDTNCDTEPTGCSTC